MLNFSRTDTIDNLISAISALPARTETVDETFATLAKEAAVARLNAARTDKINGATINFRANTIPAFNSQQLDIQIAGREIHPPGGGPLPSGPPPGAQGV